MTGRKILAPLLTSIAATVSTGCGGDVVRIPPPPAWKAPAHGTPEESTSAGPQPQLEAPREPQKSDEGVAQAARQFAMQLVGPDLARPESAEFPPETIVMKRLILVGKSNGGRID